MIKSLNPIGVALICVVRLLSSGAGAAWRLALLLLELEGVDELQEGRSLTSGLTSLQERCLDVLLSALAASSGDVLLGGFLSSACRLLAHQLALGAGAQSGLLALPLALGLLAHGSADSVGSGTGGTALSRSAHSLALRAVSLLAHVLRAAHVALRLVTVNLAGSAGSLLAVDLALRSLANRMALCWAHRVIALPAALRVAVTLHLGGHLSGGHEG